MCDSPGGVLGAATAGQGGPSPAGRHGSDEVARVAFFHGLRIDEVGALAHGLGRQPSRNARRAGLAIDVKRHVGRVRLQQSPAHVTRAIRLPHGHQAPVEFLGHLGQTGGMVQQECGDDATIHGA